MNTHKEPLSLNISNTGDLLRGFVLIIFGKELHSEKKNNNKDNTLYITTFFSKLAATMYQLQLKSVHPHWEVISVTESIVAKILKTCAKQYQEIRFDIVYDFRMILTEYGLRWLVDATNPRHFSVITKDHSYQDFFDGEAFEDYFDTITQTTETMARPTGGRVKWPFIRRCRYLMLNELIKTNTADKATLSRVAEEYVQALYASGVSARKNDRRVHLCHALLRHPNPIF